MTSSQRPPFPRVIDNTMRTAFVECPQRFALRHLAPYLAPKVEKIDLTAGSVFARGIEVVRRGIYGTAQLDLDTALAQAFRAMATEWGQADDPEDNVKNFTRVVDAVSYFFRDAYPPKTDHVQPLMHVGEPYVEWNFVEPIDVLHPETGEPILYTGRFDMFGVWNKSLPVILDEKTSKQLGEQWAQRWKLRSQFTGYVWGARRYGHRVAACIIRGVAFLKNGYSTQEAIIYRPEWHVNLWYKQLLRDVRRMIECWREGYFDYNLSEACAAFGGCRYIPLCDSDSPENWHSYFDSREWRPLEMVKKRVSV